MRGPNDISVKAEAAEYSLCGPWVQEMIHFLHAHITLASSTSRRKGYKRRRLHPLDHSPPQDVHHKSRTMLRATLCLVVLSLLAAGLQADEAEDMRRFVTMLEMVMNNSPPGGPRMSKSVMAKLCERFPIQCSRIGEGAWTGNGPKLAWPRFG
ncbi:Hypp1508 [Branchiostoma lanceolatum]|uniref:Hypp1508 protein n=1 Tax=Branchiostoma lanceolatum TaxID=7740 RepID=A0A8K0EL39_BRALA|nr:Hypp1508 [Branchiostoma lanceolatum]